LTVEQLEARRKPRRVADDHAHAFEFFKTYDLLLTPATIVAAVSDRESLRG